MIKSDNISYHKLFFKKTWFGSYPDVNVKNPMTFYFTIHNTDSKWKTIN